jgi:cytochrome P450
MTYIIIIIAEVFVAGSDTVTVSLMWTCALLCIHQDIQKKLRDEIDIFISRHGRLPSFADRLELPYYISFQKEVLRFRPPTSFGVPRKASEDCK